MLSAGKAASIVKKLIMSFRDAFQARLVDSVGGIWRPTAVQTFVEGRVEC
jgi:hypothetical protein